MTTTTTIDAKQRETVRPHPSVAGMVIIERDGVMETAFRAYTVRAIYRKDGQTRISFHVPEMWLPTSASVADVMSAIAAAQVAHDTAAIANVTATTAAKKKAA